MNIAIRSANDNSMKAYELLKKCFEIEKCYFVEPINNKKDMRENTVISNFKAIEYYKHNLIDKYFVLETMSVKNLLAVQRELINFGVETNDIIVLKREFLQSNGLVKNDGERKKILDNHAFHYLKYLEFHVADHCNLNCKNCSHFSPYVKGSVFPELNNIKRDLETLRKFVDNIGDIRIMGGECLLNPDLGKYILMVKEIYPYTNLHIVSNGLITDKISEELIDIIKANNVYVDVSAYPPIFHKIDAIVEFLEKNNLIWNITNPIFDFSQVLDLEHKLKFPYSTKEGRFGCDCINVRDGYVAICPTVCYAKYADLIYGDNRVSEMAKKGLIKLDKIESYEQLVEAINKPCELCDYCAFYRSEFDSTLQEKWSQVIR